MVRSGGSYLKQKDGSVKLVHRTEPANNKPAAAKPAPNKKEVKNSEGA